MNRFLPKISFFNLNSLLKKQLGFTLIELLVVIAIVGILAAGLLVLINPAKQIGKAHDAQRKSTLGQIQTALKTYYVEKGAYPATSGWVTSTNGDNWIPGLVESQEIDALPKDPKQGTACSGDPRGGCWAYYYYSAGYCLPGGQMYLLVAHLEADSTNGADSQKKIMMNGAVCSTWFESPIKDYYTLVGF